MTGNVLNHYGEEGCPNFKTPDEAIKWLDGKTLAAPKGSCADQFVRLLIDKKENKA